MQKYPRETISEELQFTRQSGVCGLHRFLDSFRYDTPIRLLDEERHILYENTVGGITQRLMNQRIVLSAYVERDQLIVIAALDEA